MKFYCEQCNTKYSIAEEKVRGKVLKVRCKSCGNIITVRDPEAPEGAAHVPKERTTPPSSPPGAVAKVPKTNWYYSVNGQSSAAMDLAALQAKYASGEVGDESYVWHESIVQWKPVRDVEVFAEALQRGQSVRPRAKTVGFTGPLEAIKVDDAPRGPQAGAAPSVQRTPEVRTPKAVEPSPNEAKTGSAKAPALPKPEPRPVVAPAQPVKTASPAPVETAPKPVLETPKQANEPREDRLEKLREKLRNDVPSVPSSSPLLTDLPATAPVVETPKPALPSIKPTVELSFGPGVQAAQASSDWKPVTPSTSNVFDAPFDEDESSAEDSGLIPFFPEAPRLESSMGQKPSQEGASASLLIRIDEMKDQDRKQKRVVMGVGAAALVGIAVLIGYAATNKTDTPLMAPVEGVAVKQPERRPVEKTYSDDKLNAFGIELGEEVIDSDEPAPEVEAEPAEPANMPAEGGQKVVTGSAQTKVAQDEVAANTKSKAPETKTVKRVEPAAEKVEANQGQAVSARDALLNYSGGAAARTQNLPEIRRPEDQLALQSARPKTLSKEEARKGFKHIRNSISVCRERHMRRGAAFAAKKIHISINVEPTGRVTSYKVEPASIQLTEFDTCMQGHMERWRFAPWDGAATEINSSFVIQ